MVYWDLTVAGDGGGFRIGGKNVPLVLEELLDEAPVTWARSYGGPLLPPIMLREPITDLPRDIPGSEPDSELGWGTYPRGTEEVP